MLINGTTYTVPLVTEEPTVVAGINRIAKLVSAHGGFVAESSRPLISAHISFPIDENPPNFVEILGMSDSKIRSIVHEESAPFRKHGGGIVSRTFEKSPNFNHLVYTFDAGNLNGSFVATRVVHAIALYLEHRYKLRSLVDIVSNTAIERFTRSYFALPKEACALNGVSGEEVVRRVIQLHSLGEQYRRRRATHRKALLNGLTAFLRATGQDDRSTYAAIIDRVEQVSCPLFTFCSDDETHVFITVSLPIITASQGSVQRHPQSAFCINDILKVEDASTLSKIAASVAVASLFASATALVSKGFVDAYNKITKHGSIWDCRQLSRH